jgi:ABC-type uncharacterized transport system, permease component
LNQPSNSFLSGIRSVGNAILKPVLAIILSLVAASLVLFISGHNPLDVFSTLAKGAVTDFAGTIRWTIPMIISGLAVTIAFRSGIFNLGIDGQLYMGAITATWIGLTLPDIPAPFSVILALLGGVLAGALYAFIPGVLRTLWGVSEVVTTLLFNFIAFLFTDYLVLGPMAGTGISSGTFGTNRIPENYYLARIGGQGSQANLGIVIAIVLAVVIAYLLMRTTTGYEFRMVGKNPLFARYGGIKVKKAALLAMCLSGAIGGLVGAIEILGVHRRFAARFANNLGFDGIVVSLLAGNNPIGVIFSGLFFGGLRNGAMNMERFTDTPRAMVDIINAIIILMVSAQFVISFIKKRKAEQVTTQTSDCSDSTAPGLKEE